MAEQKEKQYYLISWVEHHSIRGSVTRWKYHTAITDQHPVEFLIEARRAAGRYEVDLMSVFPLEASPSRVGAWRKAFRG